MQQDVRCGFVYRSSVFWCDAFAPSPSKVHPSTSTSNSRYIKVSNDDHLRSVRRPTLSFIKSSKASLFLIFPRFLMFPLFPILPVFSNTLYSLYSLNSPYFLHSVYSLYSLYSRSFRCFQRLASKQKAECWF